MFLPIMLTHGINLGLDSVLALIYPQRCAVCSASVESRAAGVACGNCWKQTQIFTGSETVCWKCGLPSIGTVPVERREEVRCHRCDDDFFTAARACGIYEGALRAAVLSLKRQPHISSKLKSLLLNAQRRFPLNKATRIIPVPLHPERERARGFNQASLLARELSFASSLPLDETSLTRTLHTERSRAGMDAKDRHKTVEKAFIVTNSRLVDGERVLLVDDVFTTGATVSACSRALLDAGAAEVFVLTLARPRRY